MDTDAPPAVATEDDGGKTPPPVDDKAGMKEEDGLMEGGGGDSVGVKEEDVAVLKDEEVKTDGGECRGYCWNLCRETKLDELREFLESHGKLKKVCFPEFEADMGPGQNPYMAYFEYEDEKTMRDVVQGTPYDLSGREVRFAAWDQPVSGRFLDRLQKWSCETITRDFLQDVEYFRMSPPKYNHMKREQFFYVDFPNYDQLEKVLVLVSKRSDCAIYPRVSLERWNRQRGRREPPPSRRDWSLDRARAGGGRMEHRDGLRGRLEDRGFDDRYVGNGRRSPNRYDRRGLRSPRKYERSRSPDMRNGVRGEYRSPVTGRRGLNGGLSPKRRYEDNDRHNLSPYSKRRRGMNDLPQTDLRHMIAEHASKRPDSSLSPRIQKEHGKDPSSSSREWVVLIRNVHVSMSIAEIQRRLRRSEAFRAGINAEDGEALVLVIGTSVRDFDAMTELDGETLFKRRCKVQVLLDPPKVYGDERANDANYYSNYRSPTENLERNEEYREQYRDVGSPGREDRRKNMDNERYRSHPSPYGREDADSPERGRRDSPSYNRPRRQESPEGGLRGDPDAGRRAWRIRLENLSFDVNSNNIFRILEKEAGIVAGSIKDAKDIKRGMLWISGTNRRTFDAVMRMHERYKIFGRFVFCHAEKRT